jgi:hypothetical protein
MRRQRSTGPSSPNASTDLIARSRATQAITFECVKWRFGWEGGLGTSWASDPKEELVGILMTQMAWSSPSGPQIWNDFWTSAYAAIDD